MATDTKTKVLHDLADKVGGFSALGRQFGVSGWAVQKWWRTGVVPAERVPEVVGVAAAHGIKVEPWQLRPDVYPAHLFARVGRGA